MMNDRRKNHEGYSAAIAEKEKDPVFTAKDKEHGERMIVMSEINMCNVRLIIDCQTPVKV